jgi:hypothetical protein
MLAAVNPITARPTKYIKPPTYEPVEAINAPIMIGARDATKLEHIFMKPPPVATTRAGTSR